MRRYFVDTWHFIARLQRLDGDHAAAVGLLHRFSDALLVTHDAVLMELLAFLSGTGAWNRAASVEMVRETLRHWTVIPADRPLFLRALDRYAKRPDKGYSLVDCMSMVVMVWAPISMMLA